MYLFDFLSSTTNNSQIKINKNRGDLKVYSLQDYREITL